jgi:hypothetical protein
MDMKDMDGEAYRIRMERIENKRMSDHLPY